VRGVRITCWGKLLLLLQESDKLSCKLLLLLQRHRRQSRLVKEVERRAGRHGEGGCKRRRSGDEDKGFR